LAWLTLLTAKADEPIANEFTQPMSSFSSTMSAVNPVNAVNLVNTVTLLASAVSGHFRRHIPCAVQQI
jgi:hypothetical protein